LQSKITYNIILLAEQAIISTHPGCMGEQQTRFATSHFNEAGVKDFACKIQQ
jgi:hypothetical protein